MSNTLRFTKVRNKKFATPEFSISAETQAIKGHTDYFALDLIVCHATRNVGVMMLNGNFLSHIIKR